MKDLVTKKRSVTFEDDDRMQYCSAIAIRSLVQKKEDLSAFTIFLYSRVITFCESIM